MRHCVVVSGEELVGPNPRPKNGRRVRRQSPRSSGQAGAAGLPEGVLRVGLVVDEDQTPQLGPHIDVILK